MKNTMRRYWFPEEMPFFKPSLAVTTMRPSTPFIHRPRSVLPLRSRGPESNEPSFAKEKYEVPSLTQTRPNFSIASSAEIGASAAAAARKDTMRNNSSRSFCILELAAPNFRQERQATARRGLSARCRRLTALLPNSICDFNATLLIGRDNVNDWRPTCVTGAKHDIDGSAPAFRVPDFVRDLRAIHGTS